MTLKYIWRSFQPRLLFPRLFQQSLACFRVARSSSNSWASCWFIHRVRKKRVWSISGITSWNTNTDQFLKFFHYYNLQKICNKAIVIHPTTPQTCHYTTLWNIDVRKLACPVRCGSLTERWTRQNPDVFFAAAAFLNETCLLSLLLITHCINFQ